MPSCAIVEADIAKTESTKQLGVKIELEVVGEVETVFSHRHDFDGADGADENNNDFEISIKMFNTFEEPQGTPTRYRKPHYDYTQNSTLRLFR